jgi:RimJ/RimL family protein N-acetyltransferase
MSIDSSGTATSDWRRELPTLTACLVVLREPIPGDLRPLVELLSVADACRFGLDEPLTDLLVEQFIARVRHDRATGLGFTFVVTLGPAGTVSGLVQVRQIDPSFETGEWECVLAPSSRGTGVFLETARLVGSFAFHTVGAYRLESRVLLQNGRANGALRKLGAVQEGILRRSLRRDGEYLDQVLWSLLKEDWGQRWISTGSRVH